MATYRPLDELLREELMQKTYGRVWITIEALSDDCSGKITVNSVVQNIQKMLEEEKPDEMAKHSRRIMVNNSKLNISSSIDKSQITPQLGKFGKSLP